MAQPKQLFAKVSQAIKRDCQFPQREAMTGLNFVTWTWFVILADFTGMVSVLNLELQGKDKAICDMISTISAFKCRAVASVKDLGANRLDRFLNVKDHLQKYPTYVINSAKYVAEIKAVLDAFETRFRDFSRI